MLGLIGSTAASKLQWLQLERSENQQPIPGPRMRLKLLQALAVSSAIVHMELDKGLDMVDKAGVGGKMNKSEMTRKWKQQQQSFFNIWF